jgi:hypothetical protein
MTTLSPTFMLNRPMAIGTHASAVAMSPMDSRTRPGDAISPLTGAGRWAVRFRALLPRTPSRLAVADELELETDSEQSSHRESNSKAEAESFRRRQCRRS